VAAGDYDAYDDPYTSGAEGIFDSRSLDPLFFFRTIRCDGFLDRTVDLRRQILLKQFEHFEAARKPEFQVRALRIEDEVRDLMQELYILAPPGCLPPRYGF
jgi:hypothetical protein